MTKCEQVEIARKLTDGSRTHEGWLEIMQLGLPWLLQEPNTLAQLIGLEIVRDCDRRVVEGGGVDGAVDHLGPILHDLQLILVSASSDARDKRTFYYATSPAPDREWARANRPPKQGVE